MEYISTVINHSIVGASKLLHFANPGKFAIWDSKIYTFVHEKKPHEYRVKNIDTYREYLALVEGIRQAHGFDLFYKKVNNKIGYDVSALRAIELVMFLNAPKRSDLS